VDTRLRFGKYKGEPLECVPCGYLEWLYKRDGLDARLREAVGEALGRCEWQLPFGKYRGWWLRSEGACQLPPSRQPPAVVLAPVMPRPCLRCQTSEGRVL
jgi:uncharacterized protein (DUF3820 family)